MQFSQIQGQNSFIHLVWAPTLNWFDMGRDYNVAPHLASYSNPNSSLPCTAILHFYRKCTDLHYSWSLNLVELTHVNPHDNDFILEQHGQACRTIRLWSSFVLNCNVSSCSPTRRSPQLMGPQLQPPMLSMTPHSKTIPLRFTLATWLFHNKWKLVPISVHCGMSDLWLPFSLAINQRT